MYYDDMLTRDQKREERAHWQTVGLMILPATVPLVKCHLFVGSTAHSSIPWRKHLISSTLAFQNLYFEALKLLLLARMAFISNVYGSLGSGPCLPL